MRTEAQKIARALGKKRARSKKYMEKYGLEKWQEHQLRLKEIIQEREEAKAKKTLNYEQTKALIQRRVKT